MCGFVMKKSDCKFQVSGPELWFGDSALIVVLTDLVIRECSVNGVLVQL